MIEPAGCIRKRNGYILRRFAPVNFLKNLKYTSILLLCVIAFGCHRNEPVTVSDKTPTGTTALQPIAQYYLGEKIMEPSGVVYHEQHNSLLVVSDSHPEVYEIDFQGKLIRTIATNGTDLEGIALSRSGDTIYVAEERSRRIVSYRSTGSMISTFSADVATLPNNGLEGVAVRNNGNIFVLNEKSPGMLMEFNAHGSEIRRMALSFALDYSDIFYDGSGEHLWFVSDESQKVFKTDMNGVMQSQWTIPFSKGEGITIVRDTMYIVNDADATMYLFHKPQ
jgi:uncharacterized protein YjiK